MIQSLSLLFTIASLLGNAHVDAALRNSLDGEGTRDLQVKRAEKCGWSPFWRFENDPLYVNKNPQKPCLSHGDCAGFVAKSIVAPFQPCCLVNDCICGSTRTEFTKGVNRCAQFACTADADCGPGKCVSGICNFANVEAACRSNADCGGGDNVCHEGVCHVRDANGFLTLVKNQNKNTTGSSGKNTTGGSGTDKKAKNQGGKNTGKQGKV